MIRWFQYLQYPDVVLSMMEQIFGEEGSQVRGGGGGGGGWYTNIYYKDTLNFELEHWIIYPLDSKVTK